uniref:Alpha,alpha-trehalose-phosphate synthase [UDP-forming] 56 kDa subunit n=1 Tax=Culex pipiens TaxID=7175 RepID=A0A8D8BEE3_CULPI
MSTFNLLTKEAAKAAAMASCEITITSPQEANTKSSLIVVSNRLPFVLKRDPITGKLSRHASAGGLVTAVAPVVIKGHGLWVGWSGITLEKTDEIPESDPKDCTPTAGLLSEQVVSVNVEPVLFDSYYNGCCNETFWPLFHSMPGRAKFDANNWKSYYEVNKEFAARTIQALERCLEKKTNPGVPIIWIHDYHLMLAANWIREEADEKNLPCLMAFFLHIPFPPWDIFRLLPWSDEILQGMLACDMIGFHIRDYCLNFVDCCQRNLGCRVDRKNLLVEHCGRSVRVRPLPIGIPFDRFVDLAKKSQEAHQNQPEDHPRCRPSRLHQRTGQPPEGVRSSARKTSRTSRERHPPSNLSPLSNRRQRVPGAERRDGPTRGPHQRPLHHRQLVPHPVHLRLHRSGRTRRFLPGLLRLPGDPAPGWHEPSRERVRGLPDQRTGRRADRVAVCWRW